jgi:hypothetical protein
MLLQIGSIIIAFLGVFIFLGGLLAIYGLVIMLIVPKNYDELLISITVTEEEEEDRAD